MLEQTAKTVNSVAESKGIDRVLSISIDVGELSGALPQIFTECFPIVQKDYPVLKDAEIKVDVVRAEGLCMDCGALFHVIKHDGYCPRCHSFNKKMLGGTEVKLRSIAY